MDERKEWKKRLNKRITYTATLDKESIFESIAVFYKKSLQIRAKLLPSLPPFPEPFAELRGLTFVMF